MSLGAGSALLGLAGGTLTAMTDENPATDARSAVTGEYVSEADAEANPDTTVVEHRPGSGGEWIATFVAWARGETDVLDFDGAEIPDRVAALVSHL